MGAARVGAAHVATAHMNAAHTDTLQSGVGTTPASPAHTLSAQTPPSPPAAGTG